MSRYSNKIESVGLRKCPYYRCLIEKLTSRIRKHFAELAPQNGGKGLIWRNYVTVTLCHPWWTISSLQLGQSLKSFSLGGAGFLGQSYVEWSQPRLVVSDSHWQCCHSWVDGSIQRTEQKWKSSDRIRWSSDIGVACMPHSNISVDSRQTNVFFWM